MAVLTLGSVTLTKRSLIAVCGMVGLVATSVMLRPNRGMACSMDPRPGVRFPRTSHLILVPTSRVVSAARNLPPDLARAPRLRGPDESSWQSGTRWWWKRRLTRWFRRLRDRPPYGQISQLEHIGGPDSARVAAALSTGDREVIIVDWTLDSMCRTALRTERTPAFDPGERLFLIATLRDTSGWVSGRPTFDIPAGNFVYAETDYAASLARRGAVPLTAREVLSVYEALPPYEALQAKQDTGAVMAPLRAWARKHAGLAARPPADRMIENANWYAREAYRLPPYWR